MTQPGDPHMFIRAQLHPGTGGAVWFDLAIADISAIEVPQHQNQAVRVIIGGFMATVGAESYPTLHAAWVARRRSAAGR